NSSLCFPLILSLLISHLLVLPTLSLSLSLPPILLPSHHPLGLSLSTTPFPSHSFSLSLPSPPFRLSVYHRSLSICPSICPSVLLLSLSFYLFSTLTTPPCP